MRGTGYGVAPKTRTDGKASSGPAGYTSTLRKLGSLAARALPVQTHLFDELMARFHGPARESWYLTDGGHFENTGAYELIRRRLPMIIACDHGADGAGAFTDLADLVRKVRTDFGAEVTFLNEADRRTALEGIADPGVLKELLAHLGSLEEVGFGRTDLATLATAPGDERYAALATVTYSDPEEVGLLLVIKPRVTAALPLDLREYKLANADFPQQSTGDQFFDERQWESHRKLGLEMGRALFGTKAGFWPARLRCPPKK